MARTRPMSDAMALLGTLTLWHAHPAIVSVSPDGMPLTPSEAKAAQWLVRQGYAVLTYVGRKPYLQPASE